MSGVSQWQRRMMWNGKGTYSRLLASDPLSDDPVSQLGLPEECRLHARLPGHQDQGRPGFGGWGAVQGGPELLLLIRTNCPSATTHHLHTSAAIPSDTKQPPPPRPPAVKTPTLVMFDSPTASPFSILFLSTKSCGEENRGWGEAAGPNGGRCFRTWEIGPRRSSSGTTQRFGSVSSYVLLGGDPWNVARLWWLRALSQYSLSTPLHTHTKIKNILIVHCLPQPQWPNFPVFWCFICIYIWTWIYCANVYKCFFKYARNSFDLSSSLYFLSWIPPLTLFSIWNFLLLMLNL